jgi:hypothetical protein
MRSMRWWTLCALGAVDGLVLGILLEVFRLRYENYRIQILLQEAAQGKKVGYLLRPSFDVLIPGLSILIVVGISYLVYRYLRDRPRSVGLLWLICGIISLIGLFLIEPHQSTSAIFFILLFVAISYFNFRVWKTHLDSIPLQWQIIGISSVIMTAAGTQVFGLFTVQRAELRWPALWLLCLVVVVFVNFIFGTLVRLGLSQPGSGKNISRT